jgi:hypothetical protein
MLKNSYTYKNYINLNLKIKYSIRINMMYIDIENNHSLSIRNEFDLHKQVVKYLKTTELLFNCNNPIELDTDVKRVQASLKGYTAGSCDIIIYNKNNTYGGLAIEFKSPTGLGVISKKQYEFIEQIAGDCNYFVLVSNDYSTIIECIVKYVWNVL